MSVADLPWPGNLGQVSGWCALNEEASELHRPSGQFAIEPMTWSQQQALNERFIEGVSSDVLRKCWFHQQDWHVISALAVKHYRDGTVAQAQEEHRRAVLSGKVDPKMVLALELVDTSNAIQWGPGETRLGNGQHRVCAMKAQGVPETVVYG